MRLLSSLWNLLRQALGLVLPVFARAGDFPGLGRPLRWALHVLLVAATLIGLQAAQGYFGLDTVLVRAPRALRHSWLPSLFVLVYALSWLGWWQWRLLWPGRGASDFPDLDAAWEEAVAAVHQAGIELTEAPLFLVLGRPAAGEAPLFSAAQLPFTVPQVPRDPDAPLHVHASREGIYVTCAGASLLGRQAALFAEAGRGGGEAADAAPEEKAVNPYATLGAAGLPREVEEIQEIRRRAEKEGRELTEEENARLRELAGAEGAGPRAGARRAALLNRDPAQVERFSARLRHLCGLIARDRGPYCPLNGVLALLPLPATDGEDVAAHVASLGHQDVETARDVFQLHFPVFALVCDLETVPGFVEFRDRFPPEQRHRRMGQRFPLVPDVPGEEVPPALEQVARWVCQDLVATWVYRLFRAETPEQRDAAEAVRGNVRLYHFLRRMHEKDRPLGRLLTRGVAVPRDGLSLFGGCYIAGTGLQPEEQGFIAGVFRRLTEAQNYVSWTAEALAEEADYERWRRRGYFGLAVLAAGLVTFLGYLVYLSYVAPPAP